MIAYASRSLRISQRRYCTTRRNAGGGGDVYTLSFIPRLLLVDQLFASSEMGDSMDSDLLPELSGETWVASALLEELTVDLPTSESDIDLVAASCKDKILQTVRLWVQSGNAPPWPACAGLSP